VFATVNHFYPKLIFADEAVAPYGTPLG
jgi:hypothetical protein